MRIRVIQLAYGDDESQAERVQRAAAVVRAQAGADLVVLPELWGAGGFSYRDWPERAQTLDGPLVAEMRAAAKDAGVVLHAGSLVETVPPDAPAAERGESGRGLWNTSVLIGPDGAVLATYRKIHRFGFGEGEPRLMEAGTAVVTADVPLPVSGGDPVRLGLATCYDLRFPELFRALLDAGARVVVVPAAWPAARVEAWTLLGRARAMEDQVVLVQCNTAGTHARHRMGGRSQVVAATGEVLALAGDDEEVLGVDVDLAETDRWRQAFPVLADRRL